MSPEQLRQAYPQVLNWIEFTLRSHAQHAQTVASRKFDRLRQYYSPALLASSKFVVVDRLPVPPLSAMGLTQLSELEGFQEGGITYLDMYFVTPNYVNDESLHFHELIHVVQWRLLGPELFMEEYVAGDEPFVYEKSPLEAMAYAAQADFEKHVLFDAERYVADRLRQPPRS